ncbi:hypothetical protein [Microvirus mar53]|uniref:Uncharacterized protein n=1 Tax=Microvirus mar53 TaxID=2851189 RepID=A0A8F5XUC6_9VIRU|nr:hypothetical protein [Microvirus mar53]
MKSKILSVLFKTLSYFLTALAGALSTNLIP